MHIYQLICIYVPCQKTTLPRKKITLPKSLSCRIMS